MKPCVLPFVFFLTAGTFLCFPQGFPNVPANQPVARSDENSVTAHRELLEKAKKGRIDIYFEGDSITRRWGATDYPELLANWKQNFFGWNAADFGWGADNIQNILWRLSNGELDDINPKIIVLLAGTNNVGNRVSTDMEAKVEDVTRGIRAILDIMRAKAPDATIILVGIFPRNDNIAVMPTIKKINENISKFADGKRIRFLDVTDKLADSEGKLFEGVMNPDKLHPAIKGYQIWADALKRLFTELLGPPAKEDLAPPPTGDPSAKGRSKTSGPGSALNTWTFLPSYGRDRHVISVGRAGRGNAAGDLRPTGMRQSQCSGGVMPLPETCAPAACAKVSGAARELGCLFLARSFKSNSVHGR